MQSRAALFDATLALVERLAHVPSAPMLFAAPVSAPSSSAASRSLDAQLTRFSAVVCGLASPQVPAAFQFLFCSKLMCVTYEFLRKKEEGCRVPRAEYPIALFSSQIRVRFESYSDKGNSLVSVRVTCRTTMTLSMFRLQTSLFLHAYIPQWCCIFPSPRLVLSFLFSDLIHVPAFCRPASLAPVPRPWRRLRLT